MNANNSYIFPLYQKIKNPPAMQETWLRSLGQGISSGEGNCNPLQVLAWEIPRTEELVGYSQWGCKESDTTEQLTHDIHAELPFLQPRVTASENQLIQLSHPPKSPLPSTRC